jgi:hypothetical protein
MSTAAAESHVESDDHFGGHSAGGFGRCGEVGRNVAAGGFPTGGANRLSSTMADRIRKRSARYLPPAFPTNRFASACRNVNNTHSRSPAPGPASVIGYRKKVRVYGDRLDCQRVKTSSKSALAASNDLSFFHRRSQLFAVIRSQQLSARTGKESTTTW